MARVYATQSTSKFWWRWLIVVTDLTIIFGLLIAIEPTRNIIQQIYTDDIFGAGVYATLSQTEITFQNFLYGILGAVMIGWGVMMFGIIYVPFRRGERWAWLTLTIGLVVWYVVDSIASAASGVYLNIILNTSFLLMYGIPLFATYRSFFGENKTTMTQSAKSAV